MLALPCHKLIIAGSFAVSQHDTKSIVYRDSLQTVAGLHTHLPLVSTAGREEFDTPAVEVPRLTPWEPVSASLSFSDRAQLQHNTRITECSESWPSLGCPGESIKPVPEELDPAIYSLATCSCMEFSSPSVQWADLESCSRCAQPSASCNFSW